MTYPERKVGKGLLDLDDLLISLGVEPVGISCPEGEGSGFAKRGHFPVCLDGRVVGFADPNQCRTIASHLRSLKVADPAPVPSTLEIAHLPHGKTICFVWYASSIVGR